MDSTGICAKKSGVTPLRYRLHLAPDPVAGTFAGDLTREPLAA